MWCGKCGCEVEKKQILKHWRDYHKCDADYGVTCPECQTEFKTLSTFQKHWYKFHHPREEPTQPPPKKSRLQAASSKSQEAPSCSTSITEDTLVAADEPSFVVKDPDDGGSSNLSSSVSVVGDDPDGETDNVSSRVSVVGDDPDAGTGSCSSILSAGSDKSENESDSDSDSDSGVPLNQLFKKLSSTPNRPIKQLKVNPAAASFVLNLKDKGATQDNLVMKMISSSENVVESALKAYSAKVKEKLKEKGVALEDLFDVDDAIQESSNVFENLKTSKSQTKYFEQEFHFVQPVRIPLGQDLKKRKFKGDSGRKLTAVGDELVYVPLKKTIDKLVNHPDYNQFVEEGKRAQNSRFLDCYMKGEKSKKNSVLKDHPDALRFVLYYDDLEATSPLKSKAGYHKIGAFYLYVDNIPPKHRSRLSNIMLLALVNAKFVSGKSYGIDHAIQSIVNALKEFEDGVMLPSGKYVFGTLIAVIGDNKGLHALGGFKEGFTAHRPCRFCFATLDKVQAMTRELKDLLRDPVSYKEQCDKVQTVKGKNEKLSTEYGLNRDAVLNTLESYHVIDGLPPDIMHDVLEGALPLTIKRLLRQYLYRAKKKPFTLEWLNAAIDSFDYGFSELSSKPSVLKKEVIDTKDNSTKLHQSASQLWTLATILPLIIGPLVDDDDDKYYENFLDILEICRIVFSVDIPVWMVDYLEDLTEKYLLEYKSLYGALIPKQHHLIHYARMIRLMGSLLPYMCMRMEAKHRYFKKLVERLGCFRNIFWSLALKHQLHISVEWSKSMKHTNKCGPCNKTSREDCDYKHLISVSMTHLLETSWLKFEGVLFKPNECFICVGYEEESGPVFLKVKTVIIHPVILFICHKTETLKKNIQLAAYEIQVLEEFCTSNPTEMLYHSVLHAHVVDGKLYIPVKYCAGGDLF